MYIYPQTELCLQLEMFLPVVKVVIHQMKCGTKWKYEIHQEIRTLLPGSTCIDSTCSTYTYYMSCSTSTGNKFYACTVWSFKYSTRKDVGPVFSFLYLVPCTHVVLYCMCTQV